MGSLRPKTASPPYQDLSTTGTLGQASDKSPSLSSIKRQNPNLLVGGSNPLGVATLPVGRRLPFGAVLKFDRQERVPVHHELEDVRSRIVAGDVKRTSGGGDALQIHLRVEDTAFFVQGTSHELAARGHDNRVTRIDPLVRVRIELRLARERRGNVLRLQCEAAADDPTTSFAGYMADGR